MSDYYRRPVVATVVDADENDEVIEGSEQYARSNVFASPRKEKSNTSKSRKNSRRGESSSSSSSPRGTTSNSSESSGNAHSSSRQASKSSMKDNNRSPTTKKPVVTIKRPAVPNHTKSMPPPSSNDDDVASYYGIQDRTTIAATRPRAMTARPTSYYGQSIARPPTRPPLSGSAWYGQQPAQSHYPPPSMPPTSFPPPSWAPPQSPMGPPPPTEYFAPHHNLASRFQQRPQSALGHRQTPSLEYPPEYSNQERGLTRRSSQSKPRKHRNEADDRASMPPPPRPKTTRPERISLRPAPPRSSTRGFEDEDLYGEPNNYVPVERRQSRDFSEPLPFRPRRQSITYDDGYDIPSAVEPASSSRRSSYYNMGGVAVSGSYEDKLNLASSYQETLGGPTPKLTAEALRHAQSGSSRSGTRSSYSRDERKSAATRTTRSSSGNEEDVTITVHGGAVLEIAGTKIKCDDGGEINISSGRGTSNRGSDRGTSYQDDYSDRRSHATRPSTRPRASSQSMYPRSPAIPPYPTYPHAPTHVGGYYDASYN